MTHLTLTGYYAGATLCGARKEFDAATGKLKDQYLHATYAPIEKLRQGQCKNFTALCPDCYRAWMCECDEDGTINPTCPLHQDETLSEAL